jgi:hypothetical protein
VPDRNHTPPDLNLPSGVVIKGRLRINEMTLRERRNYISEGLKSNFSENDARTAGYPEDEIEREYRGKKS